jgi:pSer/pThr/pTyr-binding forkhead associated (FHA) protein
MVDARLNSVHLEAPRREQFRAAREALLETRGKDTLVAELQGGYLSGPAENNTIIQNVPGGAQAAPAKFVLMDAEYIYPLKIGLNTVGRMPDNDVVLTDAYVSRRHCAVVVHTGDRCELHDIASKNGTYLNGQKIAGPTPLKSGDEIRMCNRQLVFVCKDEVDQRRRRPENEATRADLG